MTQQLQWGDRAKAEVVDPRILQPNKWNPNRMSSETYAKEVTSVKTHGFVVPIIVRTLDDGALEIIDGEHRWRVAQELGMSQVPVVNLGSVPDAQAKKLTITANELRGVPEPVLMAALVSDLASLESISDLAAQLPMGQAELEALVRINTKWDWESEVSGLSDEAVSPQPPVPINERRFQLGTAKGNIPARLCDELMAEFDRSARAVGSSNPEMVLRDWLDRLNATSAQVDQKVAELLAKQPPPPAKRQRAKKAAP